MTTLMNTFRQVHEHGQDRSEPQANLPVDEGQRVAVQVQDGNRYCDDGNYDDQGSNGPEQDTAPFLSTDTHTHIHTRAC